MNEQKRKRFEETLTKAFDHDRYVQFLKELLDNLQIVAPNKEIKPYSTFSAAIDHYRHIGNYTGQDKSKVALFSVCLKNDKNLENARSMQRAFVKTLLENSNCAGALVAFYTADDLDKWRLSLVRMDYEFSKGKLSAKLTPAKRYSYLVGDGEPCHTAQERLYPIFVADDLNPSLDELEEAFSVEAVTKDFFDQYREKYLDLKEFLDGNPEFTAEAKSRGFDSEQFAKKLMGQIVFLYFIQKKGWLGVNAFPFKLTEREYKTAFYRSGQKSKELMPFDYKQMADGFFYRDNKALLSLSSEDETMLSTLVKGDAWGDGPKDFMRQIFEGCRSAGKNFFDDYLEPLFYTGLNQNRGDNAFFPPLHRRIPFLNGGLFEEMEGYDWRNNDFRIPNTLFSNADTKGKRDADGILDVFDRFNFTMAEDEPMEREVAIDPEMLGKVFENLLDVTDRKSKGAFYTPREIVHYMCQETIINYLVSKTGIDDKDIRKFILYGEYFRDEDTKKTLPIDNVTGELLHGDEVYYHKHHMEFDKTKNLEMPASIFSYRDGVNRLQEIDTLLANVKVLDPAVGSGAFPVGMLTEIIKARDTITSYMIIDMNGYQRLSYRSMRNSYRLKRETIKNSIFACDIEASATDITKLRLWLSLVIDNQIMPENNDEFGYTTKPRELPNLDCNIICGNSLSNRFEGVDLITENSILGNITDGRQGSIYDQRVGVLINNLIELQAKLYEEKDHTAKDSLKEQIQSIYDEIILEQIGLSGDLADRYYRSQQEVSKPFILWQLYFPKVFSENGGFDIAIGNPPYGAKLSTQDKAYYKKEYSDVHMRTPDTYNYFISKTLRLLRNGGTVSFIVPSTLLYQNEYEKTRSFLYRTNSLKCVINIGDNVFEKADVPTCIFVAQKSKQDTYSVNYADYRYVPNNQIVWGAYSEGIPVEVLDDTPGHVFGVNKSGSDLLKKVKEKSVLVDDIADEVAAGISTGGNGVFCVSKSFICEHGLETEIIHPMLAGKIIDSYRTFWTDEYIIYSTKDTNTPQYPNLYEYLLPFEEKLSKKRETRKGMLPWWCLHWPRTPKLYEGTKIVMRQTSDSIRATIDEQGFYALNSLLVLKLKENCGFDYWYVLAVLNSRLNNYIYQSLTQEKGRAFAEVKPKNVRKLYIPKISPEQQTEYVAIARKITDKEIDLNDGMRRIDEMIYSLYGFTDEEIRQIENQEIENG